MIVMETVMNGIEKHAGFYRGYLTDDRSLIPLTIALGTIVALWVLVYLISVIGPEPKAQMQTLRTGPHTPYAVSQPVTP
jgi:hypothetical protein